MNEEIINLAIIFDFSFFSDQISEPIINELAKLFLFLQTWSKIEKYQKRKIYLSYQIVSSVEKRFFHQIYFNEFNEDTWNEIRKSVLNNSNSPISPLDDMDMNEKHFLRQLQKFWSDFYWENNDLLSPLNKSQNYGARRNISLYVTNTFYPFTITSRNIFKSIVQNFKKYSIAFVWMAPITSDKIVLDHVIPCMSLFNGYFIPMDTGNSALFFISKLLAKMKPSQLNDKSEVQTTKISYQNIFNLYRNNQTLKLNINTGKEVLELLAKSIRLNNSRRSSPVSGLNLRTYPSASQCQKEEDNRKKSADAVLFINIRDGVDIFCELESTNSRLLLFDEANNQQYLVQRFKNDDLLIFPFQDHEIDYISCDVDLPTILDVCTPWFYYSENYEKYENVFIDDKQSQDSNEQLENYLSKCLGRSHLPFQDSANCSNLKKCFFDMPETSVRFKDISKSSDDTITREFQLHDQTYKSLSMIFNSEQVKYEYFVKNKLKNTPELLKNDLKKDTTFISEFQKQIIARVFILNKFYGIISDRKPFIDDIVCIIQKLSLSKVSQWVNNFFRFDFMIIDEPGLKKDLRMIYDELCRPYPKYLLSPAVRHQELSIFDKENHANSFKIENIQKFPKKPCYSFSDLNLKRREIMVTHHNKKLSINNKRKFNLSNVKRSLFGNRSNSLAGISSLDCGSSGSIVFSISPEPSLNNITHSENNSLPQKFYTNILSSSMSAIEPCAEPKDDSSVTENQSEQSETLFDSPCLFKLNQLSPIVDTQSANIAEKKFKMDDLDVWQTTPFKLYKSTSMKQENTASPSLKIHTKQPPLHIHTNLSSPKEKKNVLQPGIPIA
ncbi:hypothetical protein RF11_04413 [Thelohanellus kitauei]|uniref:Uncharacterized protein n=1 Tax=Thelohanellus kitauei TaxID=669202 RepID=A0A0C2M977_THEKT|nr:hypothetical protein RF11_04413 [Thelohanellus kitauei]